jgi:hypothetical protein
MLDGDGLTELLMGRLQDDAEPAVAYHMLHEILAAEDASRREVGSRHHAALG